MTAHLSDSDRQALRLAHDLREELRQALPPYGAAPSISPFVDPAGRPSVLVRMDADTAHALMALLAERRAEQAMRAAEPRRADGSHIPLPPPPTAAEFAPPPPGAGAAPFVPAPAAPAADLLGTTFPVR